MYHLSYLSGVDFVPELVLLYCTFLSLKARNVLTVQIAPEEYMLRSERKLFQAQVDLQTDILLYRADRSQLYHR